MIDNCFYCTTRSTTACKKDIAILSLIRMTLAITVNEGQKLETIEILPEFMNKALRLR